MDQLASLAWMILAHVSDGGLSPYEEAKKLASVEVDFWLRQTRGSANPDNTAVGAWQHTPKNANPVPPPLNMLRIARIPYLIKKRNQNEPDEASAHYLDHLIVGYSESKRVSEVPAYKWKGTDGDDNLKLLGRFLTTDLWPGHKGKIRRLADWHVPVTANQVHGFTESASYGSSPPTWPFRELGIKPEKSVQITMGIGEDRTVKDVCYLLVGYEGGGAW